MNSQSWTLYLLPILFLGGGELPAQTETLVYELFANKGKIGTWEVSRGEENGSTIISSKRTVIFKFLKKLKTETFFNVLYAEGRLQRAAVQVAVNEEPRGMTSIRPEAGQLVFSVEGKPNRHIDRAIQFSNLTIFFEPPAGADEVFYLQKGIFLPVTALGGDVYQVDLGKGERNTYYYQEGRLVRAVLEDGLLRTTVKLVKAKQTRQPLLAENGGRLGSGY